MIFNDKKTAFARAVQVGSRRRHLMSAEGHLASSLNAASNETGGTWYPPDGHLEYDESFKAEGVLETQEETNSKQPLNGWKLPAQLMIFRRIGQTLCYGHFEGRRRQRTLQVTESEKCETRLWFNFSELPEKLFPPMRNFLADNGRKHRFRYKKTVDDSSFSVLLWQYYAIIFHSQKGGRLLVATIYSESRP